MQKRSTKLKTEKKKTAENTRHTHENSDLSHIFSYWAVASSNVLLLRLCSFFFFAAIITEGERKERLTI